MTQDTLLPGTLQRLPSFTGVLLLLGLLASFPWLPITPEQGPSSSSSDAQQLIISNNGCPVCHRGAPLSR
ncbi:MAG: hypothetical protein GEU75_14105 [Dehalococcoidia bacterium]|nr:hypothetical protein [Dehalococcoidia bacterium]